jgi:uncharacterized protein YecE (DUF72 family)
VVLEPRHETWFTKEVEGFLREKRVARVAADPARVPAAAEPGGEESVAFYRLHGSPRVYYSAYSPEILSGIARALDARTAAGVSTWCIFDNTALGMATSDAIAVKSILADAPGIGR